MGNAASAKIKDAPSAAQAAALWWTNVLTSPKLDNGDTSETGQTTALMGLLAQVSRPQPADGLEAFGVILSEQLAALLQEDNGYVARYGITLDVDYNPDRLLSECAERAGLRTGLASWPWKTTMWVKPDEVTVSYGYRAAPVVIWTKTD